jgi:hypothetical protein
VTVDEFQRQIDAVLASLEAELEMHVGCSASPIAFAFACTQAAAVVFGHYHRAMGTCEDHFHEYLADLTTRLMAEAHRHRGACVDSGSPILPEDLASTQVH